MQLTIQTRKVKCAGDVECTNAPKYKINFSKYSVCLCEKCARDLYENLGKNLVPKSVKSKFNA